MVRGRSSTAVIRDVLVGGGYKSQVFSRKKSCSYSPNQLAEQDATHTWQVVMAEVEAAPGKRR